MLTLNLMMSMTTRNFIDFPSQDVALTGVVIACDRLTLLKKIVLLVIDGWPFTN